MNFLISSRKRQGFTLIELLTVIAIIGILAAIIIPTVGKVRLMARQSQCVSNLRQMGTAIMAYANDNRGELPGRSGASTGLTSAVTRRFTYNQRQHLGYHLAPYANQALPPSGSVTLSILQEESGRLASADPESNMQLWVLNGRLAQSKHPQVPATIYYPFGWTASGAESLPKRYEDVTRYVTASRVWAIMQADRKLYDDWGAGEGPYVPATSPTLPVYGGHRNALFFDWSVAKIPLNVDVREVIPAGS